VIHCIHVSKLEETIVITPFRVIQGDDIADYWSNFLCLGGNGPLFNILVVGEPLISTSTKFDLQKPKTSLYC